MALARRFRRATCRDYTGRVGCRFLQGRMGRARSMPKGSRSRGVFFAAIVAVSLSVAAGYVAWAATRGDSSPALAGSGRASEIRSAPHVVFQNVGGRAGDQQYAHVALAALDEPTSTRAGTRLVCERVYFAADRGLCLASRQGLLQNSYESRSRARTSSSCARCSSPAYPAGRGSRPTDATGRRRASSPATRTPTTSFSTQTVADRHGTREGGGRPGEGLHRHPEREARSRRPTSTSGA